MQWNPYGIDPLDVGKEFIDGLVSKLHVHQYSYTDVHVNVRVYTWFESYYWIGVQGGSSLKENIQVATYNIMLIGRT